MTPDAIQTTAAEQFNRQSDRYGKSHILADTGDVIEALAGIPVGQGAKALDVATGGGHTALCLARQGWAVVAGDIAPKMLENARKLLAEAGFPLDTHLFPAEQMPFAADTFDLVTSRVAPHHFSSPASFMMEAARVLRPGGHLLLIDGSVPDNDPETEAWLHEVEKWRDPSHGRYLSRSSWEKLAQEAGLRVLRSQLQPFKQPDLKWYFETAATSTDNREKVLAAVRNAPPQVRAALRLTEEEGRIVWWWPRLRMVAHKQEP